VRALVGHLGSLRVMGVIVPLERVTDASCVAQLWIHMVLEPCGVSEGFHLGLVVETQAASRVHDRRVGSGSGVSGPSHAQAC